MGRVILVLNDDLEGEVRDAGLLEPGSPGAVPREARRRRHAGRWFERAARGARAVDEDDVMTLEEIQVEVDEVRRERRSGQRER